MTISKKSTIFIQSPWNFGKMINLWENNFGQVSWRLDKNRRSFTKGQFLAVSTFFYPDFISEYQKEKPVEG